MNEAYISGSIVNSFLAKRVGGGFGILTFPPSLPVNDSTVNRLMDYRHFIGVGNGKHGSIRIMRMVCFALQME
ncbi:hypothetical protein DSO57_1024004 [Entomophthora muscae]|uniref:Uncharacterized protein n=1 Tax=Entomophthora muscae TaxID=34485 RepID=A0ACC2T370_9FUNG|nr:hypothetical protein DSO57_1024004 [Entomophthora muscae]